MKAGSLSLLLMTIFVTSCTSYKKEPLNDEGNARIVHVNSQVTSLNSRYAINLEPVYEPVPTSEVAKSYDWSKHSAERADIELSLQAVLDDTDRILAIAGQGAPVKGSFTGLVQARANAKLFLESAKTYDQSLDSSSKTSSLN